MGLFGSSQNNDKKIKALLEFSLKETDKLLKTIAVYLNGKVKDIVLLKKIKKYEDDFEKIWLNLKGLNFQNQNNSQIKNLRLYLKYFTKINEKNFESLRKSKGDYFLNVLNSLAQALNSYKENILFLLKQLK